MMAYRETCKYCNNLFLSFGQVICKKCRDIYQYRKKDVWFVCPDCGEPVKENQYCNLCGKRGVELTKSNIIYSGTFRYFRQDKKYCEKTKCDLFSYFVSIDGFDWVDITEEIKHDRTKPVLTGELIKKWIDEKE